MIISILLSTLQAMAHTNGNTGGYNNCSAFYDQKSGMQLTLALNENSSTRSQREIHQIFTSARGVTVDPRFARRHVTEDQSVSIQKFNSDVDVQLHKIDWVSANQFGNGACHFQGPSADRLLQILLDSTSDRVIKEVREVHGTDIRTAKTRSGVISCSSSLYGGSNEKTICFVRP